MSDSDDDYGPEPCLPFDEDEADEDIDYSKEPDTAEEYIRRVRAEARRLPKVFTAAAAAGTPGEPPRPVGAHTTNTQGSSQQQARGSNRTHADRAGPSSAGAGSAEVTASALPASFQRILAEEEDGEGRPGVSDHPSREWIIGTARIFSELRAELPSALEEWSGYEHGDGWPGERLPSGDEERLSMCLGPSYRLEGGERGLAEGSSWFSSAVMVDNDPGWTKPYLQNLSTLDRVTTNALLRCMVEHVQASQALDDRIGLWLFALCCHVDRPLDEDTTCVLRSLVRALHAIRRALPDPADEAHARICVLLTVAGGYYGQDPKLRRVCADNLLVDY